MSDTVVVGVDPGLSGVIAVRKGGTVTTFPNPFIFHQNLYARPVLDVEEWDAVCDFIEGDAEEAPPLFVVIESPAIHGGADSRIAVAGIWWYAGIIDTAFRATYPEATIEYVRPQQWQGTLLHPYLVETNKPQPEKGPGIKERWKKVSISYVGSKYGSAALRFPRGRKENDNIADAICISEYADLWFTGKIAPERSWKATTRKKWKNGRKPFLRQRGA